MSSISVHDQVEGTDKCTETAGPSGYGNCGSSDEPDVAMYPSIPKELRTILYLSLVDLLGKSSPYDNILPNMKKYPFLSLAKPAYMAKLKIRYCNASDLSVPFSDAYCSTDLFDDEDIPITCIFEKGAKLLLNYLQEEVLPTSKAEKIVLGKLLHFVKNNLQVNGFLNEDSVLINLQEKEREHELAKVLANHFFGKLTASEEFILDSHTRTGPDRRCPCKNKECQINGYFADTSIGNKDVWHGSLDVVLSSTAIHSFERGDADGSGEKLKSNILDNNNQMIAETIVFSFLQKRRHPERDHYLFPCIGVTGKKMVVYFYDSEHDVLLETQKFAFCEVGTNPLIPILISWLVVNHQYLCSGLTDYLKIGKSGFFPLAGEKLEIYKHHLQFGGVVKVHTPRRRRIGLLKRKKDDANAELTESVCFEKFMKIQ